MAYHPCDGGNVITDAVDGAYADAECDQLIGEAVVEDAIISDYEDAVVEDAIVDAAIDDGW
ncbi:hypothetical protein L1D61_13170 [Vibrio mediterranei]|nr:hypothetical protein [Vibrio mediterranei]